MARTLFDKIWESHVVAGAARRAGAALRRSPSHPRGDLAAGLRRPPAGRPHACAAPISPSRRWTTTCPTEEGPITDPLAKAQLEALERNCAEFGVPLYATGSGREGIVHVIGPELGLTQPGHDGRLRRQPHVHPRRLRHARLRDRDLGGRARARDADPSAAEARIRCASSSPASCPSASRRRTSSSAPSAGSASPAASATWSSTRAR